MGTPHAHCGPIGEECWPGWWMDHKGLQGHLSIELVATVEQRGPNVAKSDVLEKGRNANFQMLFRPKQRSHLAPRVSATWMMDPVVCHFLSSACGVSTGGPRPPSHAAAQRLRLPAGCHLLPGLAGGECLSSTMSLWCCQYKKGPGPREHHAPGKACGPPSCSAPQPPGEKATLG